MVPLGEVLAKSEDWTPIDPERMYQEVTVRLWGNGVVQRREVLGAEVAASTRLAVHARQFIISRIDARNGASGLVPDHLEGAIVSNDFPVFTPRPDRLLPEFLGWFSKTKGFVELCRAASEGTTNRVRLKESRFLATAIPLPPLAEQRRIVARLDELAGKIEEAKRLRNEASEECQVLLDAATALMIQQAEPTVLKTIGQLGDVRGGIQKSPDRIPVSNPVRYLTVAHVHRDRVLTTDPRYFEIAPAELERRKLKAGDVLIIEGNGSAEHIGRSALFRGEIDPCVHQNHVIRVRPDRQQVDPEFLNLYLNSPIGQAEVQSQSRTTSGLRSLSVGRIKDIAIRIPCLAKQQDLVQARLSFQVKIDQMSRYQVESSVELTALLPSLLNQAFQGNL